MCVDSEGKCDVMFVEAKILHEDCTVPWQFLAPNCGGAQKRVPFPHLSTSE
jgi:hypothetical protein